MPRSIPKDQEMYAIKVEFVVTAANPDEAFNTVTELVEYMTEADDVWSCGTLEAFETLSSEERGQVEAAWEDAAWSPTEDDDD